jgi:hypothetical protein
MSLKGHAALVTLLVSAALTAARLLSISRFDVNTAATILQVSGTGAAVAGTALTLLPFALVLAACVLAVVVFVDPGLLDLSPARAGLLLWVCVGATLCLTAWVLFILTVLFVAVAAAVGWYLRRRRLHTDVRSEVRRSRLLQVQATILITVLVMTPIILQRPWLPEQAIVLKGGQVQVGYLLGDADGRLAIMSDADRTVTFVDPEQVVSRFICTTPPAGGGIAGRAPRIQLRGSPIGLVLWGGSTPSYPKCPITNP